MATNKDRLKNAVLATFALAWAIVQSGCATASAGNDIGPMGDVHVEPSVLLEIVSFDPEIQYQHEEIGPQGPVMIGKRGKAMLRECVRPVGLAYAVQQSPDLNNWELKEPLSRVRVSASGDVEVFESEYEILVDPETDDNGRQFFRAIY